MDNIEDTLIDFVEANPCLYNTRSKDYRNSQIKNEKWNEIAERLGQDVGKVKTTWKNLRGRYNSSQKKLPSGSGAKGGRKRKFTRDLSFLKPFVVAEEGSSSRTTSFPSSPPESEAAFSPQSANESGSYHEDSNDVIEIIPVNPQNNEKERVLQEINDLVKSIEAEKEPDSIDLFCDSLKNDLRQLPPGKIFACKAQILSVIATHME